MKRCHSIFAQTIKSLIFFVVCFSASISSFAQAPTTPSSGLTFTDLDGDRFIVRFTRGDGQNRIIIASENPITAVPVDGADYLAGNFGLGNEISPGQFIVYKGSVDATWLYGFNHSTTYYLKIFEYNGSNFTTDYLTDQFLEGSITTLTGPTTQASGLTFSNITGNSMTLNWTNGDGRARIIVARVDGPVDGEPVDLTNYNGSSFGNGTQVGAGNYVIYNSTGTSTNLTNLSPNKTYHFSIFEYNGNSGKIYLRPGATGSQLTASGPTIPATNFSTRSVDGDRFIYEFVRGNGTNRLVIAKKGSPVTAVPVNGETYTSSETFGLGTEVSPGEYVVYNSSSTASWLYGLEPNTTYHFAVFEHNGNGAFYLKDPYLAGTGITLGSPNVQSSNAFISSRSNSSINISWTKGNGANRLLIGRKDGPVNVTPEDLANYSVSSSFGTREIGTGNYLLYQGTGTNINITNLEASTNYNFALFEYNGGSAKLYLRPGYQFALETFGERPTIQVSNASFDNIDFNSFDVNFTSGNGTRRLVLARAGAPVNAGPADFATYSANSNFGQGDQIGSGNFVVYNDLGESFGLKDLEAGITYHFAFYEYATSVQGALYLAPAYTSSQRTKENFDLALANIITPISGCDLSATEAIQVEVTNVSSTPVEAFSIAYSINGGTPVIEALSEQNLLAGNDSLTYTFTQTADLSAKATFQISAYIILTEDVNPGNNELSVEVENYPEAVTTISGNVSINEGESVLLEAGGGTSYLWNTGEETAAITVQPIITTEYTVVVTDGNGCSVVRSVTVEVIPDPCRDVVCQPGSACSNGGCFTEIYTVTGIVRDAETNSPISGVRVSSTFSADPASFSDANGSYTIKLSYQGVINFSKTGYNGFSSAPILANTSGVDVLLTLESLCENVVCQPGSACSNGGCFTEIYTVAGIVRDAETNSPISGVRVSSTFSADPASFSDANGSYTIKLSYQGVINFSKTGYDGFSSAPILANTSGVDVLLTLESLCENVVCQPGSACSNGACIPVICDNSLTALQVSPEIGTSETEYTFTITYTDPANINLAVGYPRLELDGNDNGSANEPGDLTFAMSEIDPSDLDLTDGKIYQVRVTGLKDNTAWKARVMAQNLFNCQASTVFIDQPNVSVSNLDLAIFANNISFTNDNPNNNETITIFARVRNISDFPAESFVVSGYDGETQIFTTVIDNLGARSNIDLSWDYSFAAAGFYPIKVVIDESDVVEEINELNNFAIRPVLVGNYVLPGGIQATATPNTVTVYEGEWITISGYASYFGIDEGVNPDVAGANVSFSYGNDSFQLTTSSNGRFSRSVRMPSIPGVYTFTGSVTDYTLTGEIPPFQIEVISYPAKADLLASIILDQSEVLAGEEITGTATVTNLGELTATNFTFRYSSCEGVLEDVVINSLAPGESLSFDFAVSISSNLGSCFNKNNCSFTAIADAFKQVDDKTRSNNLALQSLTVYPNAPDLTPARSEISFSSRMETPFEFIVKLNNIGGVNTDDGFVVNVYVDNILVDSRSFGNLEQCGQMSYPISVDFQTKEDHMIRIKVDEPLGSGSIVEFKEDNNEFVRTVKYIPPPVLRPNLYITNSYLSVVPVLPGEGESFQILTRVRNVGQAPITEAFDVNFQISENGVLRNEIVTVAEGLDNDGEILLEYETILTTYGNHSVLVDLDPLNQIIESSEFDNKASMPLCVDFAVSQSGTVWNGGFFVNTVQNLTGRVQNLGLFTATNVRVDFLLDGSQIGSTIIPELKPTYNGAGLFISIPYTFREVGTFQLEMVIDRNEVYAECNESNNSISRPIRVRAPQPDLRILSEYISPTNLNPDLDEDINLFVSFENIGSNTLSPFKIRVTVDDVQLGQDILVDELGAGKLATVPVLTPYSSSTAGVKVVRGFVDIAQESDDLNYANNDASRAVIVGEAPNLLFTQIGFSTSCPQVGELVQIKVDIDNVGDLASDAEVHFYYVTETDTVPIDFVPIFVDLQSSASTSIDWTVINTEYKILAEIKNSDPQEFDDLDNFILGEFQDTVSPTLITQDITVYLDQNGFVGITPEQVDNGSFDECGVAEMTLSQNSFDSTEIGPNTVTFTVRDFSGNESTAGVIVTVANSNTNSIPTVTNPIPDQNATEDLPFNFQFAENTFNDIDGDQLSYTAQLNDGGAFPGWLSFDGVTRTFSGTPSNGESGLISIEVTTDDGNGGFAADTFDINILDVNDDPTISSLPSDITVLENLVSCQSNIVG
jgi:subtilase family serine protease